MPKLSPQCKDIAAHLKSGKRITPLLALREMGVFRLAARIHELRESGMLIASETRTINGKRITSYRLAKDVPFWTEKG